MCVPILDYLQGYDKKPVNPMYKTSAQDYGSKRPTYHSVPIEFHGKSQKFSNVSVKGGGSC